MNGLPQVDYDKLKNKLDITTTLQMHAYLTKDRALKAAQVDRTPGAVAPVDDSEPAEDISAVKPSNNRPNNGNNRNGNNRRNNDNNGNRNNGNGRAERTSQNGNRNGYNEQQPRQLHEQ